MSDKKWTLLERMALQGRQALLWLRPDGWQGRARRNAWASMVRDGQHRADRLEAERSSAAALVAAERAAV